MILYCVHDKSLEEEFPRLMGIGREREREKKNNL